MSVKLDATHVIKRPLLTERTTFAMNERKQYTFVVDTRATKPDIKAAIETLYRVRVVGVNTLVQKHKARRTRFGVSQPAPTKKAIVRVHDEDTIELF
ncbi:MAG: 50S ribosomal protein L23 [Planctomycetota bacterium]|nr:50S ribosomal protein L23 [Planctomycetota bacterium]